MRSHANICSIDSLTRHGLLQWLCTVGRAKCRPDGTGPRNSGVVFAGNWTLKTPAEVLCRPGVQAVQAADHPGQWDTATEAAYAGVAVGGNALFLAIAAVRELSVRLRFMEMHPKSWRQPVPPFWRGLGRRMPVASLRPRSPGRSR